ncbi:MAG: 5-formyltetrahydrofolate cyclo-ligase [Proteobacteria bacterium]|nr:5-formyltetrahydrofolate cyclo-ligase [Pseudomonadota bacterium]
MSETNERNAIRRLMRDRRRQLNAAERRFAARLLRNRLLALPRFRHARNIAAYHAVDGEMLLEPVIETAWSLGIPVYLPCLRRTRMEFRRYTPDTVLVDNRYGIPEPRPGAGVTINARFLDVVLTPLLAFDPHGARLGTGGGFYDRTFAYLLHRHAWKRPSLIGVAYTFQQVPRLPVAPWDVPLHGVVTDASSHFFRIDGST